MLFNALAALGHRGIKTTATFAKKKTEKPKDSKKTLRRLWGYLYEYKGLLLAAAVLMMASNIFALVGPLLSGYAIDAIPLWLG